MKTFYTLLVATAALFRASNAALVVAFEEGATPEDVQTVMSTLGFPEVTIRFEDGTVATYGGGDRKLQATEPKNLRGEDKNHRDLCRLGPNCVETHGAYLCSRTPGCRRRLSGMPDMESMEPADVEKTAMKVMKKAGVSFNVDKMVKVAYFPEE